MARVELDDLCKVYDGSVEAVREAKFAVEDGEFLVLVGPSGCGKSTLLRMIAGLEEITDGRLFIDGRLVNDLPPKERDIAMVFQNYALYPHMTAYDNMAFGLKLRKMPKQEIDRRVREAAQILSIERILARKPKALSGGQRQRVAVGRAIVREPKVFLFDEPLSNLDAKLRAGMRTELAKLHSRLEATMIYVTHDQTEAMTMGDRIVVLKDGRIQQIDTPLRLYERPANRFVAGFIGSPAMNLIEGELVQAGRLTFQAAGGVPSLPVGDEQAERLHAHASRQVTLGVRPEDLHRAGSTQFDGPVAEVDFMLDVVEPMGSETVVYARAEPLDAPIVARLDPQDLPAPGETIRLAFDLGKLHLFDAATGETIGREARAETAEASEVVAPR